MKHWTLICGIVVAAVLSGCESPDMNWGEIFSMSGDSSKEEFKTKYLISINQIIKYPRAKLIEKRIETANGEVIWINVNPLLHSRNITGVELIAIPDKPGFCKLLIKLDRRGVILWNGVSLDNRKERVALFIDGTYYTAFIPEQLSSEEDEDILIDEPFPENLAKGIQKYAAKNFKHFNPSP